MGDPYSPIDPYSVKRPGTKETHPQLAKETALAGLMSCHARRNGAVDRLGEPGFFPLD